MSIINDIKHSKIEFSSLANPQVVEYLVQLFLLQQILECWKIFREDTQKIAIESVDNAKRLSLRNREIHLQEIISEYIKLAEKQATQHCLK